MGGERLEYSILDRRTVVTPSFQLHGLNVSMTSIDIAMLRKSRRRLHCMANSVTTGLKMYGWVGVLV